MRRYRRNADDRIRRLEREAMATGDPEAGWELLTAHRRAGMLPEEVSGDAAGTNIQTHYGPLEITTTGDWVAFTNDPLSGAVTRRGRRPRSPGWEFLGIVVWFSFEFLLNKRGHLRVHSGWAGSAEIGADWPEDSLGGEARLDLQNEVRKIGKRWLSKNMHFVYEASLAAIDYEAQEALGSVTRIEEELGRARLVAGRLYLDRVGFASRHGL